MFTGFLDAGTPPSGKGTMYFHYWLVESEGNPATDPVMIWYNGGPGASSLFGLLQEWGPLRLTEDSYDEAPTARTCITFATQALTVRWPGLQSHEDPLADIQRVPLDQVTQ